MFAFSFTGKRTSLYIYIGRKRWLMEGQGMNFLVQNLIFYVDTFSRPFQNETTIGSFSFYYRKFQN